MHRADWSSNLHYLPIDSYNFKLPTHLWKQAKNIAS